MPEFARAMPEKKLDPCIVIMILPSLGTVDSGVSVTVMVTDVAPRATLLRVMAGELSPEHDSNAHPHAVPPDDRAQGQSRVMAVVVTLPGSKCSCTKEGAIRTL